MKIPFMNLIFWLRGVNFFHMFKVDYGNEEQYFEALIHTPMWALKSSKIVLTERDFVKIFWVRLSAGSLKSDHTGFWISKTTFLLDRNKWFSFDETNWHLAKHCLTLLCVILIAWPNSGSIFWSSGAIMPPFYHVT